jgi:hypothetical protein
VVLQRDSRSLLLVAIFHASFDASISRLSRDVVPASNTTRFLIFSAVIVLAALIVIIVTRGRLGRAMVALDHSDQVCRLVFGAGRDGY